MVRVALVSPLAPLRGGIAHHSGALVDALCALGHEVRVVSYRRQYPRALFPGRSELDLAQAHPSVPVLRCLTPLGPSGWRTAARALDAFDPHVVVAAWWNAGLLAPVAATLGAARARGAKTVVLAHNVVTHDGPFAGIDRAAWHVLARLAHAVVVHGEENARALRRRHPSLCVTAHRHPPYPRFPRVARATARARLSLSHDDEVCVFLGNVRPYKGADLAVRAVSQLARRRARLTLVVAGEVYPQARAPLEEALRSAPAGRVRVVDRYLPDDELGLFLSAADVLLASHRRASHSGVVQAAKAAGLPVLASRVGGLPELVDLEGGDLLFEPNDTAALARAIEAFFARPARRRSPPSEGEVRAEWGALARAILTSVALS